MQSEENAWTYLALKQAKKMALQLLHPATGYWFWWKKNNGHASFGLFSLLLPIFFSSLFLLLYSDFFFLFFLFIVTNRNSFCSLCFICCSLFSFSYCLPLSGDDQGDGNENVLCWLSSRPCLYVFSAFNSVVVGSLSRYSSFLSPLLCPPSLFFRFPPFRSAVEASI